MAGDKVRRPSLVSLLVAEPQPYVTDLDFRHASLPPEIVRFLSEAMPVVEADRLDGQTNGSSNAYDCE
jgi:hypothetical protein